MVGFPGSAGGGESHAPLVPILGGTGDGIDATGDQEDKSRMSSCPVLGSGGFVGADIGVTSADAPLRQRTGGLRLREVHDLETCGADEPPQRAAPRRIAHIAEGFGPHSLVR